MVAVTDTQNVECSDRLSIAGHAPSGALNWIVGVAMIAAAAGLWLLPGSSWDPALMLVKLGVSLFLLCGGVMFILSARRPVHPEVFLDGRRGRMRLVEREAGAVKRRVEFSYDDLSEIDFRDGMLIARDHHGRAVVEMPVEHVGDLDEIRAALGPAFSRAA